MAKTRSTKSGSGSRTAAARRPNAVLPNVAAVRDADVSQSDAVEMPASDNARALPVALYVLMGASLLLSVLFAFRVPLDTNPDEKAHFDYIRLLIENRGFVQFVKGDAAYFETHQPPLYYLLAIPFHLAGGGNYIVVRMLNAIVQFGTIYFAFRAVQNLLPQRPALALGVAAFVAFLPTQAQLSAAITNDGVTTLICVLMFWKMARIVRVGQHKMREPILVGALLGLGLLTKFSVLQLVPTILVAYLLAIRAKTVDPKRAAMSFAVAIGFAVLIASPWLIRNTLLYGDPLTLGIYRDTGVNYTPTQIQGLAGWSPMDYLRNVGVRSYATFWYFLPPDLPFHRFVGSTYLLGVALLLGLGGLTGVYLGAKHALFADEERRVLLLFGIGLIGIAPFFLRFVLTVFQAQGRYFLPALLPAAVLCCIGWQIIQSRRNNVAIGAYYPAVICLLLLMAQWAGEGFVR